MLLSGSVCFQLWCNLIFGCRKAWTLQVVQKWSEGKKCPILASLLLWQSDQVSVQWIEKMMASVKALPFRELLSLLFWWFVLFLQRPFSGLALWVAQMSWKPVLWLLSLLKCQGGKYISLGEGTRQCSCSAAERFLVQTTPCSNSVVASSSSH